LTTLVIGVSAVPTGASWASGFVRRPVRPL